VPDRRLHVVRILAVAAVYYGAAKLGLSLAFETTSVTAVWPPTGIALAALVLWGRRMWPGVALGAFLANMWTGIPIYTVLGITVGNTLEALVGAYLLGRFADFRPSLERVRDVIALFLLGGVVSTTVSATIGVGSLIAADEVSIESFGSVWRTWWLGDMGGDLVIAPALMVAWTHFPFRRAPGRLPEACALVLLVAGSSAFVFTHDANLLFLVFPPLIWAALRFWQPGAVSATLLVASVAIPLTEAERGPFTGSPDERLLLAQTLVGVLSMTGLILAAVTTERRRSEEIARNIAATLQQGLLPLHLPQIPGLETAVEFRPAGEQQLVGGDFYDWFESGRNRWDVLVGDVRGKGPVAARTTALARYTLRAEAVHEDRPSRIVGRLNDAIIRQAPDETCTVAYARLELDGPAGIRVSVSLGGHPLPILVGADGRVNAVGSPGTLLGLPGPELSDTSVELGPGDALVLYTDGLTDAYAPDRVVPPADLLGALESCAGRSAEGIAVGIQDALLDGGSRRPRDDIVVVVLRVPPAAP
jgi:integral membrane sensor domain MASE1